MKNENTKTDVQNVKKQYRHLSAEDVSNLKYKLDYINRNLGNAMLALLDVKNIVSNADCLGDDLHVFIDVDSLDILNIQQDMVLIKSHLPKNV